MFLLQRLLKIRMEIPITFLWTCFVWVTFFFFFLGNVELSLFSSSLVMLIYKFLSTCINSSTAWQINRKDTVLRMWQLERYPKYVHEINLQSCLIKAWPQWMEYNGRRGNVIRRLQLSAELVSWLEWPNRHIVVALLSWDGLFWFIIGCLTYDHT